MTLEVREIVMVVQQFHPMVQIVALGVSALLVGFLVNVIFGVTRDVATSIFDFLKVFFRGPENKEVLKDMPLTNQPQMLDLEDEPKEVLYKLGVADRLSGAGPRVDFYGDKEAYLAGWLNEEQQEEEI